MAAIVLVPSLIGCGSNSIHGAAHRGDAAQVRAFLEQGVSPAERDADGLGPIHHAARQGSAEVVKVLLDAGLDPNDVGRKNVTALHLAAAGDHVGVVTLLLGHEKIQVNLADDAGRTAVHRAAGAASLASLELIVNAGGDINAQDRRESTALHKAVEDQRQDVIEKLLALGANPNVRNVGNLTPHDLTALNDFDNQNQPIRDLLVKHGADPMY